LARQSIKFIESLCKGCGYCIEFCPNKVFEKSDKRNVKGTTMPEIVHPTEAVIEPEREIILGNFVDERRPTYDEVLAELEGNIDE